MTSRAYIVCTYILHRLRSTSRCSKKYNMHRTECFWHFYLLQSLKIKTNLLDICLRKNKIIKTYVYAQIIHKLYKITCRTKCLFFSLIKISQVYRSISKIWNENSSNKEYKGEKKHAKCSLRRLSLMQKEKLYIWEKDSIAHGTLTVLDKKKLLYCGRAHVSSYTSI